MDIFAGQDVLRLPPMLFGRIRWPRGLGAPVGNPCSGFKIVAEEHTASEFRVGPAGPEVIPGTGIWRDVSASVQCQAGADEGDMHVVHFSVQDVHLNGFPDGKYRVAVTLTGNWSSHQIPMLQGVKRIEPLAWYATLTKEKHIVSLDFTVVSEPIRLFVG